MKPGTTYYCTQCGSKNIEVHMYVNINTLEVENDPPLFGQEKNTKY